MCKPRARVLAEGVSVAKIGDRHLSHRNYLAHIPDSLHSLMPTLQWIHLTNYIDKMYIRVPTY